jgi:cell division protein FtsA
VNNPIYSTGVGLLHFGVKERRKLGSNASTNAKSGNIFEKLKSWFQGGV